MQIPARFLALLVFASAALLADDSLLHARRAQALLGSGVWSQLIRIENTAVPSIYPSVLHALVFELNGLLWFYTDTNGTQSFSLHRGRLAEEKADLGPLLRDIEPGFARWSVVDAPAPPAPGGALPNGCFVESVAAWRARLAAGEPAENARLLSYYVDTPAGRSGHTVLAYEARGRAEIVDPAQAGRVVAFPRTRLDEPLRLARDFDGPDVSHARVLPLEAAAAPPTLVASTAAALATRRIALR